MQRRSYLKALTMFGVVGIGGCLGLDDSNPNVVLTEPDRQFSSSDTPYPDWGEKTPDVTVPAPLENRQISIRTVEKPRLFTFFYSNCPSVCPVLISTMRNVQTHALNNGYGDQVEFFPLTFDPTRDTAEQLRQYSEKMNIDPDTANWHFLRPKSEARAKQIIQEQFGVTFQKQYRNPSTGSNHNQTQTGEQPNHNHGKYKFLHTPLTLLVNSDEYVERAYRTKSPDPEQIISDLKKVRNA